MAFVIVFLILALDQFTKLFVIKNLSLHESLAVIPGIFHLTLVHNQGAAFGILRGKLPLFIFSSVFAIILIYFNLKDKHKEGISFLALALILSGALGNLIDRIFLGYVVDFLDFRVWPVFNIADSAITIGAVLLGWEILFKKKF